MIRKRLALLIFLVLILSAITVIVSYAFSSLPVKDDPYVRMPGTQPGQVTLESPGRCLNCHEGYDSAVEPGFNWQGSMMAQSARDFLYLSAITVAAQDSITLLGNPNATDLCVRCHFPEGWLEGRSDPTNASLMTGSDWDGVQCDFCHRMVDPFFAETHAGQRETEGLDPGAYWDETNASSTPSQPAADEAFTLDALVAQTISLFNGAPFYIDDPLLEGDVPHSPSYTESTGGQYFISADGAKRASFADADARHQMVYSRFHKSKYMCATCHDVSNAALANNAEIVDGVPVGDSLPSERDPAYSYFHIERTFSEFMLSAYGQVGGAEGIGPFNSVDFETSNPDNVIAKCQDCHMRDVVGAGANKRGVPVRPGESVEHPESGQPLHDLTGGNVWVSAVLASAIAGSPNYDAANEALLNQGPAVLTLDLSQGLGINPEALLAGSERAKQQLELAATINNLAYNDGTLSFEIQNQTGHKLISGFPEGRRMFVNVRAYDTGDALVYEVNPYDKDAHTLKGLDYIYSADLVPPSVPTANELHVDELVYEVQLYDGLYTDKKTQHVVFATDRWKDNRIPPLGFDIGLNGENAIARLAQPKVAGDDALDYFTDLEYAGGYDAVDVPIPSELNAVRFEVSLYYQTTSREFIEFLRDEINNGADVQADPFFDGLRAWGDTLWDLWMNTKDWPGAAPYLMTQATLGVPSGVCAAPTPTLLEAMPGNQQVVLTWTEIPGDPNIAGYALYYDQAGKAQLVADINTAPFNAYTDAGLTNGQEYCYKVTSYYDATCESSFSNILCATPQNQGQTTDPAGVDALETGKWTGKGNNRQFVTTDLFAAGDAIVVRAHVTDANSNPVANATVEITIGGPETVTLNSNPSSADGWAEATWQSQKPNKKGQGGTAPGLYTASTTNVTASGYHWDGVTTNATFTIQ